MNILLTGTAGFIGSHAGEALLKANHRVIGLDNFDPFYDPTLKEQNLQFCLKDPGFLFIRGDILDRPLLDKLFSEHSIDLVIHLAARAGVRPSIQQPLLYQRVNVEGTLNILEAMRQHKVKKMIMASSSSVYGNNEKLPYSETDPVDRAISPYAATKKACEVIAYTYYHLYGIETFCLRFFTVYGPRQRPEMAIHQFTRKILKGEAIPLFGDGSTARDYTYIDDIIDGLMKCIRHLKGYEILNLGESKTVTLIELVRMIEEATGKKAALDWKPMQPGDVRKTYADIQKARQLIGYNPKVDIQEGIQQFVTWFKDNYHA